MHHLKRKPGDTKERLEIVEYGPGGSTILMKEIAPDAHIISVEHKRKWYEYYREELEARGLSDIELRYEPDLSQYPSVPVELSAPRSVDLVYVDGRRRIACLRRARQLVSPDGAVVLHDAERLHYALGYLGWKSARRVSFGSIAEKTLVFVQSDEDAAAIRTMWNETIAG